MNRQLKNNLTIMICFELYQIHCKNNNNHYKQIIPVYLYYSPPIFVSYYLYIAETHLNKVTNNFDF